MPWLSHPGCMCGVHHLSPPQYISPAFEKIRRLRLNIRLPSYIDDIAIAAYNKNHEDNVKKLKKNHKISLLINKSKYSGIRRRQDRDDSFFLININ